MHTHLFHFRLPKNNNFDYKYQQYLSSLSQEGQKLLPLSLGTRPEQSMRTLAMPLHLSVQWVEVNRNLSASIKEQNPATYKKQANKQLRELPASLLLPTLGAFPCFLPADPKQALCS